MPVDAKARRWLVAHFRSQVRFDEPMHHHTSLGVGGPADIFATPATRGDLRRMLQWAQVNALPVLVAGGGTNLLVKDGGIRGLVISLKKCLFRIRRCRGGGGGVCVSAEAGTALGRLCRYAAARGFSGLNFAQGIPGTVGGALRVNAGTAREWIGDVTTAVAVLTPDGRTQRIRRADLEFSYRRLVFPAAVRRAGEPIILKGDFRLGMASATALAAEAASIMQKRRASQPGWAGNAGCMFKNPPTGPTAGELIDKTGLKGHSVGGAEISQRHANFIVNRGDASAADILALMDLARQAVLSAFNIHLETEVRIVGA